MWRVRRNAGLATSRRNASAAAIVACITTRSRGCANGPTVWSGRTRAMRCAGCTPPSHPKLSPASRASSSSRAAMSDLSRQNCSGSCRPDGSSRRTWSASSSNRRASRASNAISACGAWHPSKLASCRAAGASWAPFPRCVLVRNSPIERCAYQTIRPRRPIRPAPQCDVRVAPAVATWAW